MAPNETAETQEGVQKIEAGDVVVCHCGCPSCQMTGKPTTLEVLIEEVFDDGKASMSMAEDPSSTGIGHIDGNTLIDPDGDPNIVVEVKKGEGRKILAVREKYRAFLKEHVDADIENEEYRQISSSCEEELDMMLKMTLLDGSIESKYVRVSMVFDLIGVKATKEQIVLASWLQSTHQSNVPDIGSALAAMLGGL